MTAVMNTFPCLEVMLMLKLNDIKAAFNKYIKECTSSIVFLVVFNIVTLPLTFIYPKIYQVLIDDVMFSRRTEKIWLVIIGILSLYLVQTIVSYIKVTHENKLNRSFGIGVRSDVWHNFINLSFQDKEKYSVGDVKQRVVDDVEKIGNFIKDQIVDRYYAYIMVMISAILIVFINPILTLICITLIPFLLWINDYIGKKSSEVNEEIRKVSDEYYGFTYNSLQFWKEIKLQNTEDSFVKRFSNYRDTLSKLGLKSIKYWGYNEVFNDFKNNYLNKVFVYIVGVFFIIKGRLTVGNLIMFAEYYGFCFNSLNTIITKNIEIKKNNPFYQRIIEIISIDTKTKTQDKSIINGDIKVEGLSFSYGENNIIKDCSFNVKSGDSLAIVGESGCGKTTLIKNLLGMLTPQQGTIYYSDKPLNEIMLSDLYDQVGVVMQDPFYFNLTIKENLMLASPEATEMQIKDACDAANILDFIITLENGFDTIIGENGIKLSGGQKQRLAIAQALLKQPKILFLDEATSALDEGNESIIMNNIKSYYPDMTVILISHKPSVIRLMNNRIELNKSKEILYEG